MFVYLSLRVKKNTKKKKVRFNYYANNFALLRLLSLAYNVRSPICSLAARDVSPLAIVRRSVRSSRSQPPFARLQFVRHRVRSRPLFIRAFVRTSGSFATLFARQSVPRQPPWHLNPVTVQAQTSFSCTFAIIEPRDLLVNDHTDKT